jgi:hypothetical protein
VEQRFTSSGYHNRFRYRINAIYPLNRKELSAHTLFLSLFEEVLLNNKAPNFEQNRIFAGFGYKFSPQLTVQTGWINRYDVSLTNITSHKNFLQVTLLFSLQQASHERTHLPSSVD